MRAPTLLLTLIALLAIAPAASAATRTETSTSRQVTATFTYDYKKTRFGTYDFSKLHVTVDRAGVRLVDEGIGDQAWPADQGSNAVRSVTVRDLDADEEPEVLVDL